MPTQPPKVFISYSSKDKKYKDELLTQLEILAQQDVISTWQDGLLVPGQQWNEKIVEHLKSSRVILLLISPDFLVSGYVKNVELTLAAERHRAGEVCVIPVLVRNVNGWNNHPFGNHKLGNFQAVPEKFIKEWSNREKAFTEVARGIQEAVEKLQTGAVPAPRLSSIPRPPTVGFVPRQDVERRRDLVERLKEELAPEKEQMVALWGVGGVGKTTLAAETARELEADFAGRIVWTSAYDRADFTLAALLDEIAAQLGQEGLRTLAPDKKAQAVCVLACAQPTLVVLDNFETISPDEKERCVQWLAQEATCPALITTREKIDINAARNIQVGEMSDKEASEFLSRLIEQTQDKTIFTKTVRKQIIKTAEANPYVMQWIYAQIDLADAPHDVFTDLSHGKGEVAERVFDRSFNLPQLGDDGRAVLLALALFVPDASRDALAQVADFGDDTDRVREAIRRLGGLRLIATKDDKRGRRLAVEGLTRSLAKARLAKDARSAGFRQRFVARFLGYAEANTQKTPENFNALEAEKGNLLGAMDVASEMKEWQSLMRIRAALEYFLDLRGYWDEAIQRGEQAVQAARHASSDEGVARFAHSVAKIHQRRGDLIEARQLYSESLEINKRLGNQSSIAITLHNLAAIAQHQGELAEARRLYDESLEITKRLGNQSGIAITLHELGRLAQSQGELAEARRLYDESLEIERKLSNQSGIASSLDQLGRLAQEQGELAEARRLYDESLEIERKLGNQSGIASSLHQLGTLSFAEEDYQEAERLLTQSLTILKKLEDKLNIPECLESIGDLKVTQNSLAEAHALYAEALQVAQELGNKFRVASVKHSLGLLAEKENDRAQAAQLLREAMNIFRELGSPKEETARKDLKRVEGGSS